MVAKVTPAGVITEYPVPTTNSFPAGIAAGRGGNLWLTQSLGNKVARVTTAGVVTEYPVPTANASPSGIAAGPDGNLWFTESIGTLPNISGKVAKIVAGPQTASPSPSSSPVGSVSAANSSPP